jgi:hypothetical protein
VALTLLYIAVIGSIAPNRGQQPCLSDRALAPLIILECSKVPKVSFHCNSMLTIGQSCRILLSGICRHLTPAAPVCALACRKPFASDQDAAHQIVSAGVCDRAALRPRIRSATCQRVPYSAPARSGSRGWRSKWHNRGEHVPGCIVCCARRFLRERSTATARSQD